MLKEEKGFRRSTPTRGADTPIPGGVKSPKLYRGKAKKENLWKERKMGILRRIQLNGIKKKRGTTLSHLGERGEWVGWPQRKAKNQEREGQKQTK